MIKKEDLIKKVNEKKKRDIFDNNDYVLISDVESIAQQLEEETRISQEQAVWILCSKEMPKKYSLYDITTENSAGVHSDQAIYSPKTKKWYWDEKGTEVKIKVLAWAEKRKPYQIISEDMQGSIYIKSETQERRGV